MNIEKGIGTFIRDMFFGLVFLVFILALAMMMNDGELMKTLSGESEEVVEQSELAEEEVQPKTVPVKPEAIKVAKPQKAKINEPAAAVASSDSITEENRTAGNGKKKGIRFHSEMSLQDLSQTKEIIEAFGYSLNYKSLKFSEAGKLSSFSLSIADSNGKTAALESDNLEENPITFDPQEMLLVK